VFHYGDIAASLRKVIGRFDLAGINAVACASTTPMFSNLSSRSISLATVARLDVQGNEIAILSPFCRDRRR
jgi:hypothetical protein